MEPRQAELLRTIDPVTLGNRLRAARVAAGLTQAQLADGTVTIGYVSRIESGQRRPDARVLQVLASQAGVSLEQLLTGASASDAEEVRLALNLAELALESGDAEASRRLLEELLERFGETALGQERSRAGFLHGRALEATGRLDEAIVRLHRVVSEGAGSPLWLRGAIALCRCLREAGDFSRSIQLGEQVLAALAELGLDPSDESIQLAVTVAGSYFFAGDTGHGVRLCMQALERAESVGSVTGRAAAYWNASIMESERSVAAAIPLAEKALALLAEGEDARNLARLRSELGSLQLHLDPPLLTEALANLTRAGAELLASSASTVDVRRNDLSLARVHLAQGDTGLATTLAGQVFATARDLVPLLAADARAVQGRAAAAEGELDLARSAYREAVLVLTGVGADRSAAQLWMELAGLLEQVGDDDGAREAYRSAAVSAGLRTGREVGARL